MANVKVVIDYELVDGAPITFRAPCDASDITGLIIYHPVNGIETSTVFTFKDAHGNDLSNVNNLFVSGAYIKVLLDIINNDAFVQNTDTNAYLEARFDECLKKGDPDNTTEENIMVSDLDMGGHRIKNVKNPESSTDAANKDYVDNKIKTVTASLPYTNWSNNVQTVEVDGVTADNTVYVSPSPANDNNYDTYTKCKVRCIGQADGTLTFKCGDVPYIKLTVNISIHN